jgi:hypothetical protein
VLLEEGLPPGTLVMIKDPQFVKSKRKRPFATPKYEGPYVVVRRSVHGPYYLARKDGAPFNHAVHRDQMKIVKRPRFRTYDQDDHNDDDETTYVVDEIIDHRFKDGIMQYKIKWKGYPLSQATWESEHQINDEMIIVNYFASLDKKKIKTLLRQQAANKARGDNAGDEEVHEEAPTERNTTFDGKRLVAANARRNTRLAQSVRQMHIAAMVLSTRSDSEHDESSSPASSDDDEV